MNGRFSSQMSVPPGISLQVVFASTCFLLFGRFVELAPADPVAEFLGHPEHLARINSGDTSCALSLIRTFWGHMRSDSSFYSGATFEALRSPPGTRGTIGVPGSRDLSSLEVTVNGRRIKAENRSTTSLSIEQSVESRPGYVYLNDLSPGAYQILIPAPTQ